MRKIIIFLLLFFIGGALLSAAGSLIDRFKAFNLKQKCKASGEGYLGKIAELKTQVDHLKGRRNPKNDILKSTDRAIPSGNDATPTWNPAGHNVEIPSALWSEGLGHSVCVPMEWLSWAGRFRTPAMPRGLSELRIRIDAAAADKVKAALGW